MSKPKLAILIIVFLVVAAAIAAGFLVWQKSKKETLPGSAFLPGPSQTEGSETTYTDEVGFSFKHPESVAVSDITPDDNIHYTLLEMNRDGKKMTVTARDTKHKTIDGLLAKGEDVPSDATLIGGLSLSGIPAKQYTKDGKLWTVAIDKGVLYLVESIKDKDFWDKAHDLLVSSFSFEKPQDGTTGGTSSNNNAVYESEEVIE